MSRRAARRIAVSIAASVLPVLVLVGLHGHQPAPPPIRVVALAAPQPALPVVSIAAAADYQIQVDQVTAYLTAKATADDEAAVAKAKAAAAKPRVTVYPHPATEPRPSGHDWDAVSTCESSRNWADNTGNGYYGGLQFSLATWRAVGGVGLPSDATREVQIEMAERVLATGARWQTQWPVCGRYL